MTTGNFAAVADLGNAIKRDDLPQFRVGDTVKVHVKVVEDYATASRSSRAW